MKKEELKNLRVFQRKVSGREILEQFPDLVDFVLGDIGTQVSFPSSQDKILKDSLVFVHHAKYLKCLPKEPCIVVLDKSLSIENLSSLACVFSAKNLSLALAQICSHFFPVKREAFFDEGLLEKTGQGALVHPTALVSSSAVLHSGAKVGPYAVIGEGVWIHEGASIGSHTVIERGVYVGKQALLHSHVFVGEFSRIEEGCEIQPQSSIGSEGYGYATDEKAKHAAIPHYGRVILEKGVTLGSNVSVDRGTFGDTVIGEGTKIDNHIHISHNIRIGKHGLITAGFISAGSAQIGDRCYIGGRTTIKGHLKITDDVHLASCSIVTRSITKKGVYGGIPILQPLKEAIKSATLIPYLPKMKKNLSMIMKKVGITGKEALQDKAPLSSSPKWAQEKDKEILISKD